MTDIPAIIKTLSPAMRLMVCAGSPHNLMAGGYALGIIGLAQLDNHSTPHRFYLTPLGLAVREELEKQNAK